jgi:hypothetical protein
MGFDHADDDVDAFEPALACLRQHGIGLTDAGSRAEENLQPATSLLLRLP